jgi:hypothetical protein
MTSTAILTIALTVSLAALLPVAWQIANSRSRAPGESPQSADMLRNASRG